MIYNKLWTFIIIFSANKTLTIICSLFTQVYYANITSFFVNYFSARKIPQMSFSRNQANYLSYFDKVNVDFYLKKCLEKGEEDKWREKGGKRN